MAFDNLTSEREASRERTESVIEARNLSVRFDGDRGTATVLDDVSIDIQRGEVLGVIGESGSGKSMFADALLNAVVEPGVVSGEVVYSSASGSPVNVLSLSESELRRYRWEEIATVSQGAQDAFNPTTRVRTHFTETLEAHDRDVAEGMERAERLLRDVYLEPERVLDSYAHELSGGMKQRALIALSLLLEPNVLIMDEPTATLDLLMQQSIMTLLRDLKEKYDLTLLFISHDLDLVAEISDRLAVMYAFEIVELGPADRIKTDAAHPYTRKLLNAIPNLDTPVEAMQPIRGSSPDPVEIPEGCSFADRCPVAGDRCRDQDPPLDHVSDGHRAACFYRERAREEIAIANERGESHE